MELNGSFWAVAATFTAWFFFFFCYHGMGITLGYHRLLTHKSLKVPNWLMYLIVSGGYFCLMGGPVNWVAVHRLHHQKSDLPGDPHSPRDGFWHSLVLWMFTMDEKQSADELRKQVPDLLKNPVLCWFGIDHCAEQAQLCLAICVLFRCLLYIIFGPVCFLANLLATFVVFWSPQLVNAVCHLLTAGYRLFDTRDDSRNVWYVALLSHGEGWHNNHHAMPKSARHGMAWWEYDATYVVICVLEKLGLAWDIVRPAQRPTAIHPSSNVAKWAEEKASQEALAKTAPGAQVAGAPSGEAAAPGKSPLDVAASLSAEVGALVESATKEPALAAVTAEKKR